MLVRVLLERVCSCYLLEEIVSAYVHIEAVECSHKKTPKLSRIIFNFWDKKNRYIYIVYIQVYTILKQVPV